MVKTELIGRITARQEDLSAEDVALAVNHILDCMSDSIAQGKRIEIRDFGSFSLRYHRPRNAHNPKTGDQLVTKGKYRPHFKPGQALRDRVNQGRETYAIEGTTPFAECLNRLGDYILQQSEPPERQPS